MYRAALKLAMDKKSLRLFLIQIIKDYGYTSVISLSDRMMSLGIGLASAGASSILLKDLIDPKFVSFLYQEKFRKLQVKKKKLKQTIYLKIL
jgi:hypothetical protein